MQCERVNTKEVGKKDGFLTLNMMKVPDNADRSNPRGQDKCKEHCLENCSSLVFAYEPGTRCMSWTRNSIDRQQLFSDRVDLYVRVAYSEVGELFLFCEN